MQVLNVDVAIIGAGSAGMSAYRAAKAAGQRVVIIEGGPYGTTCARVGCMPSKLLIAAAEAAHAVQAAPGFGVLTAPPQIDGPAVLARVRSERDRFVGFVLESIESFPPEDRLRGYARFLDPHTLQIGAVNDSGTEPAEPAIIPLQVRAASIVIATGSSANRLPELAGAGNRVQICDDVFEWPDLPKRVAVIGTGVIALELGQALSRLGVQVALFGRSTNLAHLSDPKVLESARTLASSAARARARKPYCTIARKTAVNSTNCLTTSSPPAAARRIWRGWPWPTAACNSMRAAFPCSTPTPCNA